MDFGADLEQMLKTIRSPGSQKGQWIRPLELDMSLGFAIRSLVRQAIIVGYDEHEVALLLAEVAVEIDEGKAGSNRPANRQS